MISMTCLGLAAARISISLVNTILRTTNLTAAGAIPSPCTSVDMLLRKSVLQCSEN